MILSNILRSLTHTKQLTGVVNLMDRVLSCSYLWTIYKRILRKRRHFIKSFKIVKKQDKHS